MIRIAGLTLYRKAKELSIMNRAIKYRIYPTTKQQNLFIQTFGCCRKVYNLMLSDSITSYNETGKFSYNTPAYYKKEYTFLKDVDSLALANTQLNLQSAFRNRFSKSRKKQTGFPKFKSKKHSRNSYKTNNQNGSIRLSSNKIKLPKAGWVKCKVHRQPNEEWELKSATISQDRDGKFYVSVLFEFEYYNNYKPNINNSIGLDYASDGLYVDSNGNKGSNHKFYRESHKKLAKAQRKLSRKVGSKKNEVKSNNYKKQQLKVNKIYKHISNQRLDNLHKKSTEIANQYDVVCVESLNMQSLANKGFGNGKATMDNGYGMFLNMLEYKLEYRNKYLIKVDKWFPSSQICNNCGQIHKEMKDLTNRIMVCDCGFTMNRDQNAALNILQQGLNDLGQGLSEFTLVDTV